MLGAGTRENPYLVSTEDDLNNIRLNPTASYKLTNDIYMTKWQTGEGWLPIPTFGSTSIVSDAKLDGNGFTIHDLYINRGGTPTIGFISQLQGASVQNLNFKGVNIVGGSGTGAIAGQVEGFVNRIVNEYKDYSSIRASYITNCTVSGTIRGTEGDVGGAVGRTITKLGLGSWDSQQMENLIADDNHINVQIYGGTTNVGGFIGDSKGGSIIRRSSTKGKIHNAGSNVGGFIGHGFQDRARINESYSLMDIVGSNYVGGFYGLTEETNGINLANSVQECYFAGTLSFPMTSSTYVGTIAGRGFTSYSPLVDIQKVGINRKDKDKVLYKINTSDSYIECTTQEMTNVMTYIKNGFNYGSTWFEDGKSNLDTLQLVSELPDDFFKIDGSGTEADPYLIKDVYDIISMGYYDKLNWMAYFEQLKKENDFNNPSFKPNYVFSQPQRYHYKLANDIDLNVYPFNETGWMGILTNRNLGDSATDTTPLIFNVYNSIGTKIGRRTIGRVLQEGEFTSNGGTVEISGYKQKGFLGILDGNNHAIKNLYLTDKYEGSATSFMGDLGLSGGTIKNLTFDNVLIDVDRFRNGTATTTLTGQRDYAVISNVAQATSTIERVSVNGKSFMKDYQSDVLGAYRRISGLVGQTTMLDTGENEARIVNGSSATGLVFEGSTRKTLINNCSVKIEHTYTNATIGDEVEGFFPLFRSGYAVEVKNTYSASSKKMTDRFNMPVSGTAGKNVLFEQIHGVNNYLQNILNPNPAPGTPERIWQVMEKVQNAKVVQTYYDSNIINAQIGDKEVSNFAHELPANYGFYGRSTEAMKLQATYVGWDFNRTWKTDSIGYPTLQPFDPNYVEPVNKTENIVITQLTELNFLATPNGLNRNVERMVVKSASRKFRSKTTTKRKGTLSPKTVIEPISNVAFEYKEPVIGIQTVTTNVEIIDFKVESSKARKRTNVLQTAVNGVGFITEAVGINRGVYFNGIDIEHIGHKSVQIKVNDPRIERILFNKSYYAIPPNKYITLRIDASLLTEGANQLNIDGMAQVEILDANGNGSGVFDERAIFTRKISVNKQTPTFVNQTGNFLIIDKKYYKILEHNSTGRMVLDVNLATDFKRLVGENFNTAELTNYKSTPKFSVGERGHSLNKTMVEGTFIGAKQTGNFVEEEYEVNVNGQEIVTELIFDRKPPKTNATATATSPMIKSIVNSNEAFVSPTVLMGSGSRVLNSTEMALMASHDTTKFQFYPKGDGVYDYGFQLFRFDIVNFIDTQLTTIPAKTYAEKLAWVRRNPYSLGIRWTGDNLQKKSLEGIYLSQGGATLSVWNYALKRWDAIGTRGMDVSATITSPEYISSKTWEGGGIYSGDEGFIDIMVYAPKITGYNYSTLLETNSFAVNMNVNVPHPDTTILKEVRQVFIPLENNSKDL